MIRVPWWSCMFVCMCLHLAGDGFCKLSTCSGWLTGDKAVIWTDLHVMQMEIFSCAAVVWTLPHILHVFICSVRLVWHLFCLGTSKSVLLPQGWTSLSWGSDCIILRDHKACRKYKTTVLSAAPGTAVCGCYMHVHIAQATSVCVCVCDVWPLYQSLSLIQAVAICTSNLQVLTCALNLRMFLCLHVSVFKCFVSLSASRGQFV